MTDSMKFKGDAAAMQEKMDGLRYREDARGEVQIADSETGDWTVVNEGDTVKKTDTGYTVEKKSEK